MVGGPVFKRIAEQVLAYLDVPHDVPSPSDTETAKNLHLNQEIVRAESFGHRRDQSALRIGDRERGPAEARSNGCVRESWFDRRSESLGSVRPRRDGGVPASRSRALADWQRCCSPRVPGGGNERPARQPSHCVVRPPGRASGTRGWKLSVHVKDHWMVGTHDNANPRLQSDATDLIAGVERWKVTGPIECGSVDRVRQP